MADIGKINSLSKVLKDIDKKSANSHELDKSFGDILKESIDDANKIQKTSEKASVDIATGEVKDLHQAVIAIDKAALNMKLVLEIRNKALKAYNEISKTQV